MPDALLALVRDVPALIAVALGVDTLGSALVIVGVTTLVVLTLSLLSRSAGMAVLGATPSLVSRSRDACGVVPFATQSDPDAPGRARPRAPGLLLG